MPSADPDFTILVCACGKRLKAPGAVPGRVGRCPACGGTLRAPGAIEPAGLTPRTPAAGAPVEARSPAPLEAAHPARVGTRIRRPKTPGGAIGREGLLAVPKRSEPGVVANLGYPLWDGNGVAMLAVLPLALCLASILSVGLIPSQVIGADLVTKMGALTMIGPMGLLLAFALGYVGVFLAGVIAASAEGDVLHPRVPPWQLGPVLTQVLRGLWATALGGLAATPGLYAYLGSRGALGPKDLMMVALVASPGLIYAGMAAVAMARHDRAMEPDPRTIRRALAGHGFGVLLLAMGLGVAGASFGGKDAPLIVVMVAMPGLLYAGMAAVAMTLHDSVLASNPWTVLRALAGCGLDALKLGAVLGVAGAAFAGAVAFLFGGLPRFGVPAVIAGVWAFWVAWLYVATIVARLLGLCYRRHAGAIGWFPERPQWGAGPARVTR